MKSARPGCCMTDGKRLAAYNSRIGEPSSVALPKRSRYRSLPARSTSLNNLKILFSKSQIMVRKPNSLPLLALAVAVSIASAGGVARAADDRVNEAFGAAVEAAQRRCVKIFGAGIGR